MSVGMRLMSSFQSKYDKAFQADTEHIFAKAKAMYCRSYRQGAYSIAYHDKLVLKLYYSLASRVNAVYSGRIRRVPRSIPG